MKINTFKCNADYYSNKENLLLELRNKAYSYGLEWTNEMIEEIKNGYSNPKIIDSIAFEKFNVPFILKVEFIKGKDMIHRVEREFFNKEIIDTFRKLFYTGKEKVIQNSIEEVKILLDSTVNERQELQNKEKTLKGLLAVMENV